MSSVDFALNGDAPVACPETLRIGIVVAEWNGEITQRLFIGARDTLLAHGVLDEHIISRSVPGSFELVNGARQLIAAGNVDAVIVIGCVVRGDTPHFDFVCQGVTQGIAFLNATQNVPVVFGLITTNTMEQAQERSGGRLGNKGNEYAITALRMTQF